MTALGWLMLATASGLTGLVLFAASLRYRRPNGPQCRRCGYALEGVIDRTERCPECGWRVDPRRARRPRRIRRPARAGAALGLVALSLAALLMTDATSAGATLFWKHAPASVVGPIADFDIADGRDRFRTRYTLSMSNRSPRPADRLALERVILERLDDAARDHSGRPPLSDRLSYWLALATRATAMLSTTRLTPAERDRLLDLVKHPWLFIRPPRPGDTELIAELRAAPTSGDGLGMGHESSHHTVRAVTLGGRQLDFETVRHRLWHRTLTLLRIHLDEPLTNTAALDDLRVALTISHVRDILGNGPPDYVTEIRAFRSTASRQRVEPPRSTIRSDAIDDAIADWARNATITIEGSAHTPTLKIDVRGDAWASFPHGTPDAVIAAHASLEFAGHAVELDGRLPDRPSQVVRHPLGDMHTFRGRASLHLEEREYGRIGAIDPDFATVTLRIASRRELFPWRWDADIPWWDGEVVVEVPVQLLMPARR